MPRVSVLVSNGGYGGGALRARPRRALVVAAPQEKPEFVARVNWSGVGVGVRSQRPRADRLRTAVRRVLSEPAYARRARQLRDELAACGGPPRAAELLEEAQRQIEPEERDDGRLQRDRDDDRGSVAASP